jgi:hypothetical protein
LDFDDEDALRISKPNEKEIIMKQVLSFLFIVCMVCVVGFLNGCASILSGSSQSINVTTETGKKYTASVDGQKYTVPSVILVTRENKDKMLTLDECPDQKILLHKEVNPVFFVNILSGGAFGSTTDWISGSMWKYQPENVSVKCP